MLVIPQLSNYRLIIGSLVVAIFVLGSFALSSYTELKGHQEFVQQEKKLVENELSQMITLYDTLKINNSNISTQLDQSRNRAMLMLDSLQKLKADVSVMSKIKSQIAHLQNENEQLLETIATLSSENKALKKQFKQDVKRENNSGPKSSISSLSIEKNKSALQLVNVNAKALKFGASETKRAKRVNHIQVCFSFSNTVLEHSKTEELYIQVLNPKNNVVSDKGAIDFGNASLIYSKKTTLNKLDSNNNLCETVEADASEPFTKGTYFVNIFHKAKLLGNTTIELN
ncbi:MAG TPA: hypothetical protein VKZ97_04335 [Flavobacteriaceae bacterium]|nr:hypothetical protein [Flavobacteriaceae bacterium]